MLTEPVLIAAAAVAGLCILAGALLRAWAGWLDFKQAELKVRLRGDAPAPLGSGRIEIADLKERIRKLEAIASGVDL